MKIFKQLLFFLLIVFLTFTVIFLPGLMDRKWENTLLGRPQQRDLNISVTHNLSRKEIADLFCKNDIGTAAHPPSADYRKADKKVNETLEAIYTEIFSEETACSKEIKRAFTEFELLISESSYLVKHEEKPIAFSLVHIGAKSDLCSFNLSYEEKTNTVISFTFDRINLQTKTDSDTKSDLEKTNEYIRKYYEKICLDEENFYVYSVIPNSQMLNDKVYLADVSLSFGLKQWNEKLEEHSFVIKVPKLTK